MTVGRVFFLSWCPLDLLRPRAIQVGRTAKAISAVGWEVHLICASLRLQIEDDLVDTDLAALHRGAFASIKAVPDPLFGRSEVEAAGDGNRAFSGVRRPAAQPEPWEDAAATAAIRSLRREVAPLLVSFGQPWASHRAGLRVKQALPKLRWIAHFSDPWAGNPYHRLSGADVEAMRAEERRVIEAADALIFVTRQAARLVMSNYPQTLHGKTAVIPHLLDMDLAAQIVPMPRNDRGMRIVHAGYLYGGRRAPAGLVGGLGLLKHAGVTPDDLEIRFVGDMPESVDAELQQAEVAGFVRATPPLYYVPSLREMAAADVLLAIDADFEQSPFLPSKVIDYLMLDRPMAALTPPGSPSDELLRRLGYPTTPPSDAEGISAMFRRLMTARKSGELAVRESHRSVRDEFGYASCGRDYDALLRRVRDG